MQWLRRRDIKLWSEGTWFRMPGLITSLWFKHVSSQALVEIRDVNFAYDKRAILKGINMTFHKGKLIAVMGLSGCGKTTILRHIGGVLKPTKGYVKVDGQVIHDLDQEGLYRMRRKMGMLFQFGALFTDMTVYDNVAFQMREHTDLPEEIIRDLVMMKLHAVGLYGTQDLFPAELSGGMARRVALARTIALDPMLIMYDEPFAGLDPISLTVVGELIRRLNDALGSLVALSLVRELGPVLAALLFASRAGSAMTAEIGLMKATEQISAMEMMAVNPIARVVAPRFWAGVISMPLLAAMFSAMGVFGGYVVGVVLIGVDEGSFWSQMQGAVDFRHDVLNGVIKSFVFGVAVTVISLFEGYDAPPTAEGVSGATTRTVVQSSLAILMLDFMLTAFMFGE